MFGCAACLQDAPDKPVSKGIVLFGSGKGPGEVFGQVEFSEAKDSAQMVYAIVLVLDKDALDKPIVAREETIKRLFQKDSRLGRPVSEPLVVGGVDDGRTLPVSDSVNGDLFTLLVTDDEPYPLG